MTRDEHTANRESALTLTRELHGYMVEALAARFGYALSVDESPDPENGLTSYRFEHCGAVCSAGLAPISGELAVFTINGWLGRVYHDHGAALRWLCHNRACNTLAIFLRVPMPHENDLRVSANRNTLSGDRRGIQMEIDDFCTELEKTITGIRLWFPQFFEASAIEGLSEDNKGVAMALEDPKQMLEAIDESEDRENINPVLFCYLTRWLGEWERNLEMSDSTAMRELADEQPQLIAALPFARLRTLRALQKYDRILSETLPSVIDNQLSTPMRAAIHAECLCGLNQYEDALEHIRSAEFDSEPWVHFMRAVANMKLGHPEEAIAHLREYESLIGSDVLACEKLAALMSEGESEDTDNR
jgi:tetratricopeptide (TPR) repeat protein